jgi:hypothetical protein
MTARLKGTAVQPSVDYIRTTYGDAIWTQVLDALPPDARAEVSFVQSAKSYPVSLLGELLSALVQVEFAGNRSAAEQGLREMGRHTAAQMLSGIYALFVRMSSPEKTLERIAQVVQTLYEGATTELEHTPGEKAGVVHIRGLGEFAYASPRLCGWAERALEQAGASSARVVERSWKAGKNASDELVFEASWS